jgi:hypothetical protein
MKIILFAEDDYATKHQCRDAVPMERTMLSGWYINQVAKALALGNKRGEIYRDVDVVKSHVDFKTQIKKTRR